MVGLVVGVTLIASLLLVHFSLRQNPMPPARPLNVDVGLPLPEIGQASTVFSLTALFGAYLSIYILLGIPALVGLACGTVSGLLVLRHWIDAKPRESFEAFVSDVFGGAENALIFAFFIAGVQCAFAVSELVILPSVAQALLGLHSEHATLLVVAVGLIAYFYVLFGGYMAVFRTDVLQFALVAAMGIVAVALLAPKSGQINWSGQIVPRSGYWPLPHVDGGPLLYGYHFLIGMAMGLGFIIASPDAWKRVFLVSAARRASGARFRIFVIVGTVPFLVLIPIGMAVGDVPDGAVDASRLWNSAFNSDALFTAMALGLIASFLSAFNGALVTTAHIGIIARRESEGTVDEYPRFHWLMAAILVVVFLTFAALHSFENPYVLANLLLGPYAVIAGVQLGCKGSIARLREGTLVWIVAVGCICWFLYFVARGLPNLPSTYQINTTPPGVALAILTALASRLLTKSDGSSVQRQRNS